MSSILRDFTRVRFDNTDGATRSFQSIPFKRTQESIDAAAPHLHRFQDSSRLN